MSKVRADNYSNRQGTGAPDFPDGLNVTGAAATFTGNVTIGGTLTYQDVTNVDSIGIVTAQSGVQVLAGGVGIADSIYHLGDTNTQIRFPAADTLTVETAGSEAIRVDSSGQVLIGTSSAVAAPNDKIQINSSTGVGIHRGESSVAGPRIDLTKSRNATHGSNTIVQSGDLLGSIFFRGDDGTDYNSSGAQIFAQVDGTPGANDMPGRLVLATSADGSASPTERLRITSGGGIHFNNGELIERVNVTSGKLSDNTNINLENGMMHLFTTTETTTATPNIMTNTGINTHMAVGDAMSVTIVTTAAAAGYAATVHIDGVTVGTNGGTLNWTGGSAPSDGGSSGVDIYAYTIMKTASATYTVIATQTKTS